MFHAGQKSENAFLKQTWLGVFSGCIFHHEGSRALFSKPHRKELIARFQTTGLFLPKYSNNILLKY
jgi:hypothetical protein